MEKITLIFITCILIGCSTKYKYPKNFGASSNEFRGKYAEFLEEDEIEINSWYHYVTSKNSSGEYYLRIFYPETKQITSEVTFTDQKLTNRSGYAKYWHENGHLSREGKYLNNAEIGIWKFYSYRTGKISQMGTYKNDMRSGDWKFFDQKGRLKEELSYVEGMKNGKFIRYDSLLNVINEGIYKDDEIIQQTKEETLNPTAEYVVVEKMPYLSICREHENEKERNECSNRSLLEFIYKNIKYPSKAREYGLEGTTITQFVIDKDGSIKDIEVIIGLNDGFKNECLRVIQNMPKWEAGTQKGEKVKVRYTLPIKFRLA